MFLTCDTKNVSICEKDAINPHILVTGKSGTGKSVLLRKLIEKFMTEGKSVVFLDFDGSGSDIDTLDVRSEFIKFEKGKGLKIPMDIVDIMRIVETLLTAFKINNRDVKSQLMKCFSEVSFRWSENAKGLSTIWEEAFEIPLAALIESYTKVPTELAEMAQGGYISYTLTNGRLLPMKGSTFWHIDFSGIPLSHRCLLAEYILAEILNHAVKGQMENGLRIVIDEFQNFDFSSKSTFGRILVEGRKYNLGLCLATQFLRGAFSDKKMAQLGQEGMSFYFQPSQDEKNMIVKALAKDATEVGEYKRQLSRLQRGECIMQAPHTIGNSNHINTRPRKVRVLI